MELSASSLSGTSSATCSGLRVSGRLPGAKAARSTMASKAMSTGDCTHGRLNGHHMRTPAFPHWDEGGWSGLGMGPSPGGQGLLESARHDVVMLAVLQELPCSTGTVDGLSQTQLCCTGQLVLRLWTLCCETPDQLQTREGNTKP